MAKLRIPLDYKEKNIKMSMYDLSAPKLTTLMQGLETPIKSVRLYPKDDFRIDYNSIIDSMPMVGRMLSDYKLRIKVFKCPLSNYYSWMDNNARLTSAQLKSRQHHVVRAVECPVTTMSYIYGTVYIDLYTQYGQQADAFFNSISGCIPAKLNDTVPVNTKFQKYFGVQPNSLLDYFGLPVGFVSTKPYSSEDPNSRFYNFNADFILSYLDCVRNYLVNNQYESVPYMVTVPNIKSISTSFDFEVDENVPYVSNILKLSLTDIDAFFKLLRNYDQGAAITLASINTGSYLQSSSVFTWLMSLRYGGMFCSQFDRDMMTNLLRTVNSADVTIDTSDGSFSINEFRFKNRQQLVEDRFDISGGRWKNVLRTIWGVDGPGHMDIPELVGVTSHNINPKSIISSANTYDKETDQGNSAGQMNGFIAQAGLNSYQHRVVAKEDCILLFVASLIPDVIYRSGLGEGLDNISFDDEYKPQFDQLGFRDVPRFKYNCLPRVNLDGTLDLSEYAQELYKDPVGKNVAFIDMISAVGRAHGHFALDQYYETWALINDFTDDTVIPNLIDGSREAVVYPQPSQNITSYINPLKFQYPFVVQSGRDSNFVFQFGVKLDAVRPKGKWFMPTLGN